MSVTCSACNDTGAAPCDVSVYPNGICPFDRSPSHKHPCVRCGCDGSALCLALHRARAGFSEAAELLERITKDNPSWTPRADEITRMSVRACSLILEFRGESMPGGTSPALLKDARALLLSVEWVDDGGRECAWCHATRYVSNKPENTGTSRERKARDNHRNDCRWLAFIKDTESL